MGAKRANAHGLWIPAPAGPPLREQELELIARDLPAGARRLVSAPPLYGKSVLGCELSRGLAAEGALVAHACLRSANTPTGLIGELAGAAFNGVVIPARGSWSEVSGALSELTGAPAVEIRPHGQPHFHYPALSVPAARAALQALLSLLGEIAAGPRAVFLILDEIGEAAELLDGFEDVLLAGLGRHQRLGCVAFGQAPDIELRCPRLMREWTASALAPLPFEVARDWIDARADHADLSRAPGAVSHMAARAGGHPRVLDLLTERAVADARPGRWLRRGVVEDAWTELLGRERAYHQVLWRSLRPGSRALLSALCQETRGPYSREFRERHQLGSVGVVQKSLRTLRERGLVEQARARDWRVVDPLLADFCRRMAGVLPVLSGCG